FCLHVTHTTSICPLSLHDALPIFTGNLERGAQLKLTHYGVWHYFEFGAYADDHHDRNELGPVARERAKSKLGLEFDAEDILVLGDRKSTRLNSSHVKISYAVFCLK